MRILIMFWHPPPPLPVVSVPRHLPQFIVQVGGGEGFIVDQVPEVVSVGDEQEDAPVPQALREGRVGVPRLVDVAGPRVLAVDDVAGHEVAGGHVRHVPHPAPRPGQDLRVVGGLGVVAARGQRAPEVAPCGVGCLEQGGQDRAVLNR